MQTHTFGVSADAADEVDALARHVLCEVGFFKWILGIRYANLHRLADADAATPAFVGRVHGTLGISLVTSDRFGANLVV